MFTIRESQVALCISNPLLIVFLTGIQYAGAHLKELQNAFKNPTANLGLIFEEASKRVVRSVGLASPPAVDHLVNKELAPSAVLLAKVSCMSFIIKYLLTNDFAQGVDNFGQTVEMVLIKYGKSIVNEQFILNRLANSAIDIYTSAVVLSRASNSLEKGLSTANHEKLMAEAWIFEVSFF